MYTRYSSVVRKLHEDFAEIVNQKFPRNKELNNLNLSERVRKRIETGEIVLVEKLIPGGLKLFRPKKTVHTSEKYGEFFIEYRSYNGLVAFKAHKKYEEADSRWKAQYLNHGVFDFYFDASRRYEELYGGDATHSNIFRDLYTYATYEQCLSVYNGEEINHLDLDSDQSDALTVLSWLFFEQELNYGSLPFQQYSNFTITNQFRPRDMIMGFLSMMYLDKETFDAYPHWNFKRTSPTFGAEGFPRLENRYRVFFENLNGSLDIRPSLFCNETTNSHFSLLSQTTGPNPNITQ